MNRLELLPLDISTSCLLPYIRPNDFDTFCSSCPRLQLWSSNPDNIRRYLIFRKLPTSPNDGLIWAIGTNSNILIDYFLSLNPNNYDRAMIRAAEVGNLRIVKLMSNLVSSREPEIGYDCHNFTLIIAAKNCHLDIVKLMLNLGAHASSQNAINEAREQQYLRTNCMPLRVHHLHSQNRLLYHEYQDVIDLLQQFQNKRNANR